MRKFLIVASLLVPFAVKAQTDTLSVYKDRADTLAAAAVSGSSAGSTLSRFKDIRTEVISAAGLCKMACCNLAESFENSASVSVGYSDAVTGARQIRLLGLSGTYTQMLDENRPVMRGLAAPFGLSYIPGQWLQSIQIAKGAPSVINGVESITGQINMEHRKPTDEVPLFVNFSGMSNSQLDLNAASSLQLDKQGKWSTVIMGHVCGNFAGMDTNGDGFLDDPRQGHVSLTNRWLYFSPGGTQVRFGVRFLRDSRSGGQFDSAGGWNKRPAYNKEQYIASRDAAFLGSHWGSSILNQSVNAYLKVGVPLNEDNTRNVAVVADFNDYTTDAGFGKSLLGASQISGFANILYQEQVFDAHHFTLGLSTTYDRFSENFRREVPSQIWMTSNPVTSLVNAGAFGEYTFHYEEKLTAIAGVRADWYNNGGFKCSPRLTVRYTPVEQLVIRFNGGRGLRSANPIVDNIGVLSTNKRFFSNGAAPAVGKTPLFASHPLEDAWVAGGNITCYLPFGVDEKTYVSFDYFRTQFKDQLIVDYDRYKDVIDFYMLDGRSFTNTYQADFFVEPIRRFTVTATFRYTDARVSLAGRGLQERPMTSRYKGVLNLQYATNLNKWIFDFTCSVNGPCRLNECLKGTPGWFEGGYSPVYPLLYAQVTHRMKGWDIYVGGENLTNFTQKNPIVSNPSSGDFDASCIWGPLMGIKGYLGVRITLWKKS